MVLSIKSLAACLLIGVNCSFINFSTFPLLILYFPDSFNASNTNDIFWIIM